MNDAIAQQILTEMRNLVREIQQLRIMLTNKK